ncbi:hypothetical protein N7532_005564 [Penicillium argentinense]|uniref:Tat pathway signal sequence domain protein n=1 Tax=Penicillium argentinense TaxID=1131581 RepID=A0A9W9KA29_9EURO|nr:uncharacterized protein N7532_005564 [Penicillium argentinense]KAJ5098563.1 hypothetical protein N7532_005564 [Penicillium argentinense]
MMTPNLRWLNNEGPDALHAGISFGMPWSRGLYRTGQTFVIEGDGTQWPLDSRELAYWADGSLKWTAHSVSGDIGYSREYTVKGAQWPSEPRQEIRIVQNAANMSLKTSTGLVLNFVPWYAPKDKSLVLQSVVVDGDVVCSGATVVATINGEVYDTVVNSTNVETSTSTRVVIKVSGVVENEEKEAHLPFDMRFYVYADASSVRIVHSFVHDLDSDQPLTSLGLRFFVPMKDTEHYNRHIRLGGPDGGVLNEQVKGLSGLRHGPTNQSRMDQVAGRHLTVNSIDWSRTDLSRGLSYIPSWSSYSLSQLSSDGFTIKKRTKPGCSWVKVNGGGRADGTAYVGSTEQGGIAIGMSDFWERYPTQLDLDNLASDEASTTIWLYSPSAEPLDTTPYHDSLGLDTYAEQLEALNVTYEDYEPGFATAYGIGRSNQIFLRPFRNVPSNSVFSSFSSIVRNPPRLVATATHMHEANAFHGCWAPDFRTLGRTPSARELVIENNLNMLFNYYHKQVEQNRWYGFWDHGDVQHTYDIHRHAWRYDVGGFSWDNSELSTDLWLWLYFLHTGRADVFKMAEAMTRHTGEVDVYHTGRFKGFGTRHGVQHFSDSSKQLRISNVLYRRIYYYLTGDERTGDLISELQNCGNALLGLDSHRKVQEHAKIPAGFAMTNIGLDCGPLFASWLTSWEQRGYEWGHCQELLLKVLDGISGLKHGIGNNAILLNPETGEVRECPPPTPDYAISHLSMLFGFPEIVAELCHYLREESPATVKSFMKVWLAYCRSYNGGPNVQHKEFGFEFPEHATWRQSHSTLTAFAAVEDNCSVLAKMAWDQFFYTDGYTFHQDWDVVKTLPPEYFTSGEEAKWVSTNETARYGISAISNLANIGKFIWPQET